MRQGIVVAISGVDGSGKSTQTTDLYAKYQSQGKKVLATSVFSYFLLRFFTKKVTRNKKDGIKINTNPLLKCAGIVAIIDFWARYIFQIWWWKWHNDVILCDRYFPDMLVNLCYYGYLPSDWLSILVKLLPPADKIIFLNIDPQLAYTRSREFPKSYYFEQVRLYRKVLK